MKIAIVGKGGVGKTFLAYNLIKFFAKDGFKVIGIDCDNNPTLSLKFGVEDITPLSKREDIIEERTGAKPNTYGTVFKINPKVDDLVDKVGYKVNDKITLIVMGTIEKSGQGCVCPASTLLRRFLRHLILKRNEVVILDMEAGLEHFGRKTLENIDMLIIVVENTKTSLITGKRIKKLANELGIKNIKVVINKVIDDEFKKLVEEEIGEVIGVIPYDKSVVMSEFGKRINKKIEEELFNIYKKIKSELSP
ncbi:AAA family ATPase [Methanocaldococcus indicus]|uniref:ATP-binding protein n=1 Tax=Methanocaldococcus indicus TaxID=213231 RepID=UPI003C6D47E5